MRSVRHWSVRHARSLELIYKGFCRVMPILRPGLFWLGLNRSESLLAAVESKLKGLLFDCRMCGQCVLSATGMACPMNCAKRLPNGPCGGVTSDGCCEVHRDMPCVWLEAFKGAGQMATQMEITTIRPPVDYSREGSSSWLRVALGENETPANTPAALLTDRPPAAFEQACRSGHFLVTAEISPPDSADPQDLLARAEHLCGLVDAVNVTDSAGANCHMSSLAASAILTANGYAAVFQTGCRDRNRIAIQADIVGAAALGVRNLLCLTGDDVKTGDHPQARPVFDLDAVSLLGIASSMRDRGTYASGRKLTSSPNLFLGSTISPFVPTVEARLVNLQKKIDAGAQFIQTQFCFDLEMFSRFMAQVRDRGLERRCHILVGVGPLSSVRVARWLNGNVPGVVIPEQLIRRLEQAKDPKLEGKKICIETILALREVAGVAGIHLMGHRNERVLAEIIAESGAAQRAHAGADPIRCHFG
jgi:methylenetetrahydrofolate reductase (NADH)